MAEGKVETKKRKTSPGEFARQVRAEASKVVWPTRQETMQTTLMVIVVVLILSVFIWALDVVLAWAVRMLTGR